MAGQPRRERHEVKITSAERPRLGGGATSA